MNIRRIVSSAFVPSVSVLGAAVLLLAGCAGHGDGGGDGGGATTHTDAPSVAEGGGSGSTGPVDAFLAVATAAGWSCISGADPFTGKPGATCTPGAGDTLTKAVFAVFDSSVVPDGAAAVALAGTAAAGDSGGDQPGGQFLPLDGDHLSGYCVNTLGNCGGSDFESLGIALG